MRTIKAVILGVSLATMSTSSIAENNKEWFVKNAWAGYMMYEFYDRICAGAYDNQEFVSQAKRFVEIHREMADATDQEKEDWSDAAYSEGVRRLKAEFGVFVEQMPYAPKNERWRTCDQMISAWSGILSGALPKLEAQLAESQGKAPNEKERKF